MQPSSKTRPLQPKSKPIATETNHYSSFYDALTHSPTVEYHISKAVRPKLHINPKARLSSFRKMQQEGRVLHERRKQPLYFRGRKDGQSELQILCFLKNKNESVTAKAKAVPTEMNPAFREKMKKHLKHYRSSTQEVENEPCFTGSSVLLHKREKIFGRSSRELSCNRSQAYQIGLPLRAVMPTDGSRPCSRGRYYREAVHLSERSCDVISPWSECQRFHG